MANGKLRKARAFLFDLDGTLIDSKTDLVAAVNAMLRATGRPEQSTEIVASYIGHGAPRLIASVLGSSASDVERAEGLRIFLEHYEEHKLDATRAYPGVGEGLKALADLGLPMAVLTNKPVKISVEILRGLGLEKYFQGIYGGDSFAAKKPDPAGALQILRELRASPEETAMVGDSDVDLETARNSGMLAVAVNYGFGKRVSPADVYVDSLVELGALVDVDTPSEAREP
jgi:phosphoglycolate phosphatase